MPIEVHSVIPATYEDLCLAHDPAFVLEVLTGELDRNSPITMNCHGRFAMLPMM